MNHKFSFSTCVCVCVYDADDTKMKTDHNLVQEMGKYQQFLNRFDIFPSISQ